MGRQTGQRQSIKTNGHKVLNMVSYLSNKKRFLKIGLLEPSKVETDPRQTDGHIVLNKDMCCDTFKTKKQIFKIGLFC